ncbi:MAG: hypothetical protein WAV18_03525, partial [Roseiarcus sp.]
MLAMTDRGRHPAAFYPVGPARSLDRHCEFRTGLRPVPLDETTRSRVMPANAGIQNATSLSGFELFI